MKTLTEVNVHIKLQFPISNFRYLSLRAYSSVGQSARLISVRSVVQIYLGPPFSDLTESLSKIQA